MTVTKTKKEEALDEAAGEQPEDIFDTAAQQQVQAEAEEAEVQEAGSETLEAALEQARQEAHEAHDKMLRMAAECENLRKRMQREREISLKYAEENIIKELLPSLDNFERAIEQGKNSDDVAALLEGVELTQKGLLSALEKYGLKPIESMGEPFDPNYHEAMGMEASDQMPPQHVMQVYEKGYMFKDRLIRAAKVVVSMGKK